METVGLISDGSGLGNEGMEIRKRRLLWFRERKMRLGYLNLILEVPRES